MGAVERISQYFGIPKSAILDDSKIPAGFEPLPATDTVPLVGRIACGEPITAEENLEPYPDRRVKTGKYKDFRKK